MNIDAEIAALPKMPEWKGGTIKWTYPDYKAEDLPEFYLASVVGAYQARLALLRRVLQSVVDAVCCDLQDQCICHEAYTSRQMIDPNCRYHDETESRSALADARKVLEATK